MTAHTQELSCQQLVELVTEYLEGTLDDARLAALDAHLVGCDGCGTYVEQMRRTVAALRGLDAGATISAATRDAIVAAFAGPRGTE
jgi:anti-sigma factor RsiW